jgi:Pyruvate/2-oxoacid:ferredoxin oxidoreductase gamma subunit
MIGNYHENMSVQAYFEYDAKKSSGWTISHLRFSPDVQIEAPFRVEDSQGDYVACHNEAYVQANKYDVIRFCKRRGTFFLNTAMAAIQDPKERIEALEQIVSPKILRNLALRNIKVGGSLSSLMFHHRTLLIFLPLRSNQSSILWTLWAFPENMDLPVVLI